MTLNLEESIFDKLSKDDTVKALAWARNLAACGRTYAVCAKDHLSVYISPRLGNTCSEKKKPRGNLSAAGRGGDASEQ